MLRILIVDDDEVTRSVIKEHLSVTYEVIDTGVPETALALALEHKPEAILLDLSMPGLSGFELCQALSSLSFTQHIPIFVSGEDERNKAFCQNLGASRYFTKPIDFTQLKTDLASVLRSKRVERRADVRVQLRVILKLRGTNKGGMFLEVRAATENVSKGGFLCACASSLEEVTTVEVYLCGEPEHYLGQARLVRVVKADALNPRYGFQFIRPIAAGNGGYVYKTGETAMVGDRIKSETGRMGIVTEVERVFGEKSDDKLSIRWEEGVVALGDYSDREFELVSRSERK